MGNLIGKILRLGRGSGSLPVEGRAPEFAGVTAWLNSDPLTMRELRGRVVLIDFWTFSCINCLRTLPHVQAWHEAYRQHGLAVVGLHTPEFSFEHGAEAVRRAVDRFGLTYPVALDDDYLNWKSYGNRYWPAHYFIDAEGDVRAHHYGEGGYAQSEQIIRQLLAEAGHDLAGMPPVIASLPEAAGPGEAVTPETYLGWDRLEYLGSPESVRLGTVQRYSVPPAIAMNTFYLNGAWQLENEYAQTKEASAGIVFRIRAAQAYLVMAGPAGAQVEVRKDGAPVEAAVAGADVRPYGSAALVTLDEPRLYHLLNDKDDSPKTLELILRTPDIKAFAFTFA